MGDRVRAFAVEQLGDVAGRQVWDLYAGIGETTAALVARRCHGRERGGRPPRGGGGRGARARRRGGTRGRVEDVLRELRPPDLVITNPPRTGMDARVTEALERLAPEPAGLRLLRPGHAGAGSPAAARLPALPRCRRSISFPRRPTSRRWPCWSRAREVRRHVLDGQTIEVEVDGERVTVGGRDATRPSLGSVPGTPLRQLLLDGRPRRWRVEAAGPGPLGAHPPGRAVRDRGLDERTRHIRSLTGGGDRPRGRRGAQGADARAWWCGCRSRPGRRLPPAPGWWCWRR